MRRVIAVLRALGVALILLLGIGAAVRLNQDAVARSGAPSVFRPRLMQGAPERWLHWAFVVLAVSVVAAELTPLERIAKVRS